jgi:outer membrane lipoprotein carrier protein
MFTKFKIFLLLLLLQMPFAYAEQKPVAQLKSFLATTKTLTANFKQVVLDESGKVKQTSFGTFKLSRPGKFRWDYQKPFNQEIVSNSGKVWFYDADLEQVTIKKLDKSMGSTPALLLTGDVELEKEFTMEKQGSEEAMLWVKLVPKNPESNFKYVLIGLNEGELGGMELSDNFGQLTRIYFSEVEINPTIKADDFNFVIPKGVDVLEDKEQDKSDKAKEQDKPQENTEAVEKKEPAVVPVEVKPQESAEEPEQAEEPAQPRHKAKVKSHPQEKAKESSSDKGKHKDKAKEKHSDKSKEKSPNKSKDKSKTKEKSHDKSKSKEKSKDKHK